MALELINPPDLPVPEMYTQVVVATGSKLVFVSGQQPEGIDGKLVGQGDFAAQARLAFGNLGRALRAAGARPEQVCKITIYIVDTTAMNMFRSSKRRRFRCLAITNRRMWWSGWRSCRQATSSRSTP